MSLLDCGCGPGSITVDFAEIVAPGEVVGIDIEPLQIERAQVVARERGVINVRFTVADAYALPFADATFDAVFAHAMLYHVREPLRILREFRRVLNPAGLLGIRDTDYSMWCMEPATSALDEARRLSLLVAEHDGASPTYARHQRHLLIEAGFAYAEATASCVGSGTLEQTRRSARALLTRLRSSSFQQTVLQQAWADRERLDTLCAEVQAWGEKSDAFECLIWRSAVGWVSSKSTS